MAETVLQRVLGPNEVPKVWIILFSNCFRFSSSTDAFALIKNDIYYLLIFFFPTTCKCQSIMRHAIDIFIAVINHLDRFSTLSILRTILFMQKALLTEFIDLNLDLECRKNPHRRTRSEDFSPQKKSYSSVITEII